MSNSPLFAVVDLGTNTFHLLVGRWHEGRLEEHYRERHFVKLAAEGIAHLGDASAARAVTAATSIGKALRRIGPAEVRAFGTAALRTAANGEQLRKQLSAALTTEVLLIDGQREAQLIARGVIGAGLPHDAQALIMDIGGGSVEFILTSAGALGFSESFPLGAQVLRQRFHRSEPFVEGTAAEQEEALFDHLRQALKPLLDYVSSSGFRSMLLVGASGTFDVLADLFGEQRAAALWHLELDTIEQLYEETKRMTEEQRLADTRLPEDRADMIVVALALIVFVLRTVQPARALTCSYALKEGALLELSATH